MSKRGGKRAGAGRPPKDDAYDNAYKVWAYVQKRTAETGAPKAAKKDAERQFGMCRTTVIRNLEYVGKVASILKAIEGNPAAFNVLVESLTSQGWFVDDA